MLLAFDLVECNGKDLRDLSLIDRKKKLLRLLGKTMTGIQFVDHFPDDGESVFQHACLMGLEGIVSKRIDAPYRSGPSKSWLARKRSNSTPSLSGMPRSSATSAG